MTEQDDFTKIRVGDFTVGIMGLKAALEEAVKTDFSSDRGVAEYLLKQLKAKNYIPPPAEAEYAQAFLREYKKYKGEEVEVEKYRGLEVKILGPGCPNCDKLEQMVYKVMADEGMAGNVEHVRDLREIASYGLVATPALVINGEIKVSGRLPRESQLRKWLEQAK
ncbi:MAG: thioredoxin family protein [Deltaproteobacteria bacterium]|nr:thioredoxin family protein [Deltaproteobacteria bacterium]